MLYPLGFVLAGAFLTSQGTASPTPSKIQRSNSPNNAAIPSSAITNSAQLASYISAFEAQSSNIAADISVGEAILTQIVPAPGPTAAAQAQKELQSIWSANPGDIFASGAEILANGLAGGDYVTIAEAYLLESGTNNINPIPANPPVYPFAGPNDAPYSASESTLRSAIYIPFGFTYGKLQPVIFIPGTASVAGQTFGPNFGKLFTQNKIADPVYLNIPGENLADIAVAAEYVAYAVGYISAISGHQNVTTLSWSAGSLDGQWALKYWPSIRPKISDTIRISPDHRGTIYASSLCPGTVTPFCTAAIAQQITNSTFIGTLRSNGGDSAYVPATNIYSIFDEIVQPQEDPNASGALDDARGVGVANVELQAVCSAALPGGSFYNTHEGVLYNALAYALAVDAIQHPGPGSLARVDVAGQCAKFAADGLSLADIFATEALIPIAAGNILAYQPKAAGEPPIMGYAVKDEP